MQAALGELRLDLDQDLADLARSLSKFMISYHYCPLKSRTNPTGYRLGQLSEPSAALRENAVCIAIFSNTVTEITCSNV